MKLCVTGGGTGGHLMIAEAIVEAAVAEGHECIFIGSKKGQDRKYFEHGSSFSHVYFLDTTGVVNQKGLGKLKALYKILKALLSSRKILKKHKVDAVYSVGGFSAAPASFAALTLYKPLFIHEQNAVTGRLNGLLKRYARSFVSAYDKESPIKGYPVKSVFYKTAHLRQQLRTIIFLGGSHGAKAINDLALSIAWKLKKRGIAIIHQAGEADFERVKEEYETLGVEAELYGFTKELPSLINRADMAVSRSGASTLWELTTNGCPALYVPYPYAARDHQYDNAKFIVDNNMGWCEREGEGLKSKLLSIIKEPQLKEKSQKLLEYAQKDVAQKMIKDVEAKIQ
ncbi:MULTISPECIES: undecaprenyldiphospho-muramoylpentapeptide beta-N-acetylglucosaminyltransferase [Sulfurimonas]|uniref:undecaprenyldiphospho-muramoylpentapeptide beta-N-acetylglucosaminyltransferase n=1 Tax=Sulfurimonas TaxID=202746 RepID=UPI0012648744|nr:undecaprenyldiphospho-muramoylpentapeptide beta-N-acetylglucosaminyltransferase [Sulfurimonas indica]